MKKLNPIIFGNDLIRVHPIQDKDTNRLAQIEKDLFEIFSDDETTKYNPEKKISTIQEAKKIVADSIMGYKTHSRYNHFITHNATQSIIGYFIIIPPIISENEHKVKNTWVIEYFLNKEIWNNGLMTGLLGALLDGLKNQGIEKVGAFVNNNNIGSIRVLQKNNFIEIGKPDKFHTYFERKLK